MDPIDKAFRPLYGRPSYLVHQGYGSMLTMEFGEPQVVVGEVRERPHHFWKDKKKKVRRIPSRLTSVRGEWHLWIKYCSWVLFWNDRQLAHSESSRPRIERELSLLDGQSLTYVAVSPLDGQTTFAFDLGCSLRTRPYGDDPEQEQWTLAEPSGLWWSVRADGRYSYSRGDTSPDAELWRRLPRRSQPTESL